jgi:hypothetical protein
MTSTRSLGLPHLAGLSGPTNFRLNRNGSPVFTLIPLVACWLYEPREHRRSLALLRDLRFPPSPERDRVGYSDHLRFRGYFPVHFIPAYNLAVYASQWPSPDTTQDSVRGCSLGFTAAATSGDRVQRTCTTQPAQHRTCEGESVRVHHPLKIRDLGRQGAENAVLRHEPSSRATARAGMIWNSIRDLHQGPRSPAASRGRIHDRSRCICRSTKKALAERGHALHPTGGAC